MKILILAPTDGQTWRAIKDALLSIGHNCTHICSRTQKQLIQREINNNKYDFIFTGKEDLLNITFNAPLIGWNTDKRRNLNEYGQKVMNTWKQCKILFTNSDAQRLSGVLGIECINTQQGLDPYKYNPVDAEQIYDASFIGNINTHIHKGRRDLIQALHRWDINFKHFTNTWDDAHNLAVAQTKINISHHAFQDFEVSQSVRDYKIMGAGGFLLTQYSQGLENHFREGVECEFYRNELELTEKIYYYLNNPEQRKQIAIQGYNAVITRHTYKQRLIKILNTLYNKNIIPRN